METLVVLDAYHRTECAGSGKSNLRRWQMITGIILTKMDGTAKGGIAVAIQSELGYSGEIYWRRREH